MQDDKISIIMTIKNETKFLINVMDKLCAQKPDQLILVDGGSTDDHINLIATLQKKYNFEYVVNAVEAGSDLDSPFGAFLAGLPYAKHDYVSLWSVDDDPYPAYIPKMREMIEEYHADLYVCSAVVARENETYKRVLYPFDAYISPECMVKNLETFSRRINLVGSVIRKHRVLETINYITKANFDCTYFFHTALTKGIINIGDPLILYRSYMTSHGQLGKIKDILEWARVSKELFMLTPDLYERAVKAGLWSNLRENHKLLNLFPKLPKFIRKIVYKHIYSYDSKEEK